MKPTLMVLAAGMGSRYGGNKQLDQVGPSGETIIDYSIYDANRAGFGKVVFVIRRDIEEQFKEIEDIIRPHIDCRMFMTRCIECNTPLRSIQKEEIESRVPEYIYHHHEKFMICPSCNKIYWEGTHAKRIKEWIGAIESTK